MARSSAVFSCPSQAWKIISRRSALCYCSYKRIFSWRMVVVISFSYSLFLQLSWRYQYSSLPNMLFKSSPHGKFAPSMSILAFFPCSMLRKNFAFGEWRSMSCLNQLIFTLPDLLSVTCFFIPVSWSKLHHVTFNFSLDRCYFLLQVIQHHWNQRERVNQPTAENSESDGTNVLIIVLFQHYDYETRGVHEDHEGNREKCFPYQNHYPRPIHKYIRASFIFSRDDFCFGWGVILLECDIDALYIWSWQSCIYIWSWWSCIYIFGAIAVLLRRHRIDRSRDQFERERQVQTYNPWIPPVPEWRSRPKPERTRAIYCGESARSFILTKEVIEGLLALRPAATPAPATERWWRRRLVAGRAGGGFRTSSKWTQHFVPSLCHRSKKPNELSISSTTKRYKACKTATLLMSKFDTIGENAWRWTMFDWVDTWVNNLSLRDLILREENDNGNSRAVMIRWMADALLLVQMQLNKGELWTQIKTQNEIWLNIWKRSEWKWTRDRSVSVYARHWHERVVCSLQPRRQNRHSHQISANRNGRFWWSKSGKNPCKRGQADQELWSRGQLRAACGFDCSRMNMAGADNCGKVLLFTQDILTNFVLVQCCWEFVDTEFSTSVLEGTKRSRAWFYVCRCWPAVFFWAQQSLSAARWKEWTRENAQRKLKYRA